MGGSLPAALACASRGFGLNRQATGEWIACVALSRRLPLLGFRDDATQELSGMARSRPSPYPLDQRLPIVLACAASESQKLIAKLLGENAFSNSRSCKSDLAHGVKGLSGEIRPGQPRTDDVETVAEVINRAWQAKFSAGSTQWSTETLAAKTGISKTTFPYWPQTFTVQMRRQKTDHSAEALAAPRSRPTHALTQRLATSSGSASVCLARRLNGLTDGIIYPDSVESAGTKVKPKRGGRVVVKSRHNVLGLNRNLRLMLMGLLCLSFKNGVHKMGQCLGLLEEVIGPFLLLDQGWAIGLLGQVLGEKCNTVQEDRTDPAPRGGPGQVA